MKHAYLWEFAIEVMAYYNSRNNTRLCIVRYAAHCTVRGPWYCKKIACSALVTRLVEQNHARRQDNKTACLTITIDEYQHYYIVPLKNIVFKSTKPTQNMVN